MTCEQVGLLVDSELWYKNDDPEALMAAAEWWIMTHKLDHFEKAQKILRMIEKGQ